MHLNGESWAVPKGVPLHSGSRVLAIKTAYHTPKQARFEGEIKEGYGKGVSKVLDEGDLAVISESPNSLFFQLRGETFRGNYYLKHWKGNHWLLWKRP